MKPDIYFFVQIRMGSTRLPGKALLPVAKDLTMVEVIHRRLQRSKFYQADRVLFLTSDNQIDDFLADYFEKMGWHYFRGPEEDVFQRYRNACKKLHPHYFVRICADNPFIEATFIDMMVDVILEDRTFDYVSFVNSTGVPVIKTHYGFFAELVRGETFTTLSTEFLEDYDRQHVTPIFYRSPRKYNIRLLPIPSALAHERVRLTVDTEEDLTVVRKIFANVGVDSDIYAVYDFLARAPDLCKRMERQIRDNSKTSLR